MQCASVTSTPAIITTVLKGNAIGRVRPCDHLFPLYLKPADLWPWFSHVHGPYIPQFAGNWKSRSQVTGQGLGIWLARMVTWSVRHQSWIEGSILVNSSTCQKRSKNQEMFGARRDRQSNELVHQNDGGGWDSVHATPQWHWDRSLIDSCSGDITAVLPR